MVKTLFPLLAMIFRCTLVRVPTLLHAVCASSSVDSTNHTKERLQAQLRRKKKHVSITNDTALLPPVMHRSDRTLPTDRLLGSVFLPTGSFSVVFGQRKRKHCFEELVEGEERSKKRHKTRANDATTLTRCTGEKQEPNRSWGQGCQAHFPLTNN